MPPELGAAFNLGHRLALRPKEAAEALGVSERLLRKYLPELPHVRLGGAVVIPVDSLRQWLQEQAGAWVREGETSKVDAVVSEVLADFDKDDKIKLGPDLVEMGHGCEEAQAGARRPKGRGRQAQDL